MADPAVAWLESVAMRPMLEALLEAVCKDKPDRLLDYATEWMRTSYPEQAAAAAAADCLCEWAPRADVEPTQEGLMAYLEETLPSFFSLRHPGTKLLCVARAGSARVGAYDYDRRNSLECSGREFRRGQIYTSVGFFGGHEGQTPPPMPVTMHGTMQMPMLNFPMHMNWQIAFTLPASANLTDTPLFVNDAVAMMAVQTDGSITNATSSSDPDNAELARLSEECGAYASGGMTPPGQRAPR